MLLSDSASMDPSPLTDQSIPVNKTKVKNNEDSTEVKTEHIQWYCSGEQSRQHYCLDQKLVALDLGGSLLNTLLRKESVYSERFELFDVGVDGISIDDFWTKPEEKTEEIFVFEDKWKTECPVYWVYIREE